MKTIIFFILSLPIALIGQVDSITIQPDGDNYRIVQHFSNGSRLTTVAMSAQALRKNAAQRIIGIQDNFYKIAGQSYFSNARATVLQTAVLVDNALGTSRALFGDMRAELDDLYGYYQYGGIYIQLMMNGRLQQVNQSGQPVQGGVTGTWFADSRYHLVFLGTGTKIDDLDFVFDPFTSNTFRTADRAHTITKVR